MKRPQREECVRLEHGVVWTVLRWGCRLGHGVLGNCDAGQEAVWILSCQ